jgi:tetratricopeptide (TPR) repeat protein
LARLALISNNTVQAEAQSLAAMSISPNNLQAVLIHVEALLGSNKVKQAQQTLVKLSNLVLSNPASQPQMLLVLGRLRERAGQIREAREVYARLRASTGGEVAQVAAEVATVELALLRLDLRSGDVDGAQQRFSRLDPSLVGTDQYKLLRADIDVARGAIDIAQASYLDLLQQGNRLALFRLVGLYHDSGNLLPLRKLLRDWLAENTNDIGAEVALANVHLTLSEYGQAAELFESVLAKQPNNVVVLNNLAWLYLQTGDARATSVAQRAYALAPRNADVADTLGWILLSKGDIDGGSRVLHEALALAPDNPTILYHVAKALADAGATERAIATLKRTEGRAFAEADAAQALVRALSLVH